MGAPYKQSGNSARAVAGTGQVTAVVPLAGRACGRRVSGMFFVCRWREDSPFSKRVVRVPDVTVLDWFRRGWDVAGGVDPYDWVDGELGGNVYGLDSIFDEAGKRHLPRPD